MTESSRRARLAWRLTPPLILAAGAVVFAVLTPGAVRQGIASPRTWLIFGAAFAVGVLLWWLIRRSRRPGVARLAETVGLLPVAGLMVWSMAIPLLSGPVTVDDQAPAGATLAIPTSSAPALATSPSATAAPEPDPAAPPSAPPTTQPPPAQPPATQPPASPPATEPQVLGSDTLVGIDHAASGTAGLIALPDGALLVRLEQFAIEAGPDYHVYVVPTAGATVPDGGTYLGPLRETEGNKNFTVPAGVSAEGPLTVLVWCEAFAVPVANAAVL